MDAPTVISLILGGGLVAALVAIYKAPRERTAIAVDAQSKIIANVATENERLLARNQELETEVVSLRTESRRQSDRIADLEDRVEELMELLQRRGVNPRRADA